MKTILLRDVEAATLPEDYPDRVRMHQQVFPANAFKASNPSEPVARTVNTYEVQKHRIRRVIRKEGGLPEETEFIIAIAPWVQDFLFGSLDAFDKAIEERNQALQDQMYIVSKLNQLHNKLRTATFWQRLKYLFKGLPLS